MVLDSKAFDWAGQQGLDTAALKKAKVPIYGKWYFPDLPDGVPLVNLQTGQVETFGAGFRAGAILYVKEEDLKRAGLGPYKAPPAPPAPKAAATPPAATSPVDSPEAGRPITDRSMGTASVAAAAAVAPVQPSASPTMPAVGQQQPVRALHHDAGPAPAGRAVTSHAAHDDHAPHGGAAHGAVAAEHAHPGPSTYVVIAVILAVITAVEVAVYYIPALFAFIVPILLVLSIAKFVMVVGYFMHLKFDHKLYAAMFAGGLTIALAVFLGVGLMFLITPPGGGN